jgi:hypothetical protein
MPEPGIRYQVYLVVRSSAPSYAEAFAALVARQAGRPFSAVVPTARFLTDDLEQQMRSRGVPVIALAEVLEMRDGRMVLRTDPQQLFSGLGAPVSAAGLAPALVARAILRDRARPPRWLELDDAAYRDC